MARKNGLNRKEQILAAKWMTEGIDPSQIAKKFHTTAEVIKRFTQEKMDAAEKRAQDRLKAQNKATTARREKAKVLTEAIEVAGKESANAEEFK